MVGRQGSGKTQFFKQLAAHDLDMVAAGEASMVVLDPVGCHPAIYRKDKYGKEDRVSPSTLSIPLRGSDASIKEVISKAD